MRLREATPADVEAVRAVHRASIEGLGPVAYDDEQVAAWASGTESADYAVVDSADHYVVVAERGEEDGDGGAGEVVAFGCLRFAPPEECEASVDAEVTAVYVHPAAAGAGVGSAVLADLEERAREHDADALGLTASRNTVPFYEARGYESVREHDHEFSPPSGVEGRVVEMTKEL